uniref:Nuclear transport factor 2 n=1 Tax=Takifugu rubripes TaxID=31033 RepID=A0A674NWK9_TAKRU
IKSKPPPWEQIGSSFVHHYYKMFDTDRGQLASLYVSMRHLDFQGKKAIMDKLNVSSCRCHPTAKPTDHQPTLDQCIASMVVGQLKADNDHIMGFHQCFILKHIGDAWVCTNDMFRLAIHNFG